LGQKDPELKKVPDQPVDGLVVLGNPKAGDHPEPDLPVVFQVQDQRPEQADHPGKVEVFPIVADPLQKTEATKNFVPFPKKKDMETLIAVSQVRAAHQGKAGVFLTVEVPLQRAEAIKNVVLFPKKRDMETLKAVFQVRVALPAKAAVSRIVVVRHPKAQATENAALFPKKKDTVHLKEAQVAPRHQKADFLIRADPQGNVLVKDLVAPFQKRRATGVLKAVLPLVVLPEAVQI
jgi:hypothetical protein